LQRSYQENVTRVLLLQKNETDMWAT
jgi:hypothetical protein